MAQPIHAKVLTLFERIMAEDNNVYRDLFRPDAKRILYFGADAGKVGTPADALPFPRKGGPLQYWNRTQYFGDHCFVEVHTATYQDKDRCHPKLLGLSMEVLAVCELDDEGYITRFEEYADMAFMAGGKKRPVPPPARPPTDIVQHTANNSVEASKVAMEELFSNIMLYEDSAHLFAEDADVAQMFATTFWEGTRYFPMRNKKTGKVLMGRPDFPIYTNRRVLAGPGWVLEHHRVTLTANAKKPERRYRLQIAVLNTVGNNGKFSRMLEFGDPNKPERATDLPAPAAAKL